MVKHAATPLHHLSNAGQLHAEHHHAGFDLLHLCVVLVAYCAALVMVQCSKICNLLVLLNSSRQFSMTIPVESQRHACNNAANQPAKTAVP
jgi:hypothetical protein